MGKGLSTSTNEARTRFKSKVYHKGLSPVNADLHNSWLTEITTPDGNFRPFADWKIRYEPPKHYSSSTRRLLCYALDIVGEQVSAEITLVVVEYFVILLDLMAKEAAARTRALSLEEFLGQRPTSVRIPQQTERFIRSLSALACTFRFQGKKGRKFKYIRASIVAPKILQGTCALLDELEISLGFNARDCLEAAQLCHEQTMSVMMVLMEPSLSGALAYISNQPIVQELQKCTGLPLAAMLDASKNIGKNVVSALDPGIRVPADVGANLENTGSLLKARLIQAAAKVGTGNEFEDVFGTMAHMLAHHLQATLRSGFMTKVEGKLAGRIYGFLQSLSQTVFRAASAVRNLAELHSMNAAAVAHHAFDAAGFVGEGLDRIDFALDHAETISIREVVAAAEEAHSTFTSEVKQCVGYVMDYLKDSIVLPEDDDD